MIATPIKLIEIASEIVRMRVSLNPTTAFYPQKLEKILSENGWEAKAIIGAWHDRGWLDHDKDRNQKLIRSKSSEERVRFYCLKRSSIEEELGIPDATVED